MQTTTAPTGAPIIMPRLQGTILPSEHNVGVADIEVDSIVVFPVILTGVADIADIEVDGSNDCVDVVIVLPVVLTGQVHDVVLAHRGCTGLCIALLIGVQFLSDEELNTTCP